MNKANVKLSCIKCNGTGKLPEFTHIQDGDCFLCEGTGHFGDMTAEEVSAILAAADKANFDRKHAPYYVESEFFGYADRVVFFNLKAAAEYVTGARKHPKVHGRVRLCHRDGTLVTRGEVRAA